MTPPTEPTGLREALREALERDHNRLHAVGLANPSRCGKVHPILRAALASPEPSGDVDAAWADGYWPVLTDIRGHDEAAGTLPRWGNRPVGRAANEAEHDRRWLLTIIEAALRAVAPSDAERLADWFCMSFDHHEHEAFLQADHCNVGLSDATAALAYARAAAPSDGAGGLDVERLARAMFRVTVELPGLLSDVDMLNDPAEGNTRPAAAAIAAEYDRSTP